MCPDRELLSAWVDGEVPSPWKETVERHLAACADCSGVVAGYRSLSDSLRADASAAPSEPAKARVLEKLYVGMPPVPVRPLWRKRLAVPVPLAAAAALAFAVMALSLAVSGRRNGELRLAVRKAVDAVPVSAPGMGMDSFLEFLARQDAGVNITITLPSGPVVGSAGEPVIVRSPGYGTGIDK